jgi:hypothetical protein
MVLRINLGRSGGLNGVAISDQKMNSVRDDYGFGIERRPKLLIKSYQKVYRDYHTHLALKRALFNAT